MSKKLAAFRAATLHFIDDPHKHDEKAWQYFDDGILVLQNGVVQEVGSAESLLPQLPKDIPVEHFPNGLIVPGLVDTHVHYPQTEMIAAHGEQLLNWLNTYTFPTEKKFVDEVYAGQIAEFFLDELLRNGTTTAMVFATVHKQSVNAFFDAANKRKLRMISGKVLMDCNAPLELSDTVDSAYQESRELIKKWHGVGRLHYAVTPRFAPTSSKAQLDIAGKLLTEFDGIYLHTHLAENIEEVSWVKSLFPQSCDYLDVYDRSGLVTERSVFAHGVHLSDHNCQHLAACGSAVAHCPTSNLFLGSGLINLSQMQRYGVKVGLGTDVGAGTSFSLFRTMDEAYKIQQLRGSILSPMQALYLATLGGARALSLDNKIGSFHAGNDADFIVLDLHATKLIEFRLAHCRTLQEKIFVLNTLGDDRLVERTYVQGECMYKRDDQ